MTLPEGWKSAPLGAVTDFIVDGSHNPPAKQSTGLPMLSARNIHDGALSYEGRLISEADFLREDRRTNVAPGDVLLTIVGTIGRAAVVPIGSPRFTLQRSVAVIKPGQLLPKFLMYQMQSSGFQRQLTNSARGTAQKGVYLRQLGDMGVKLAPLPQQSRIVARIEELFSDLDAGVAALERVRIALKRYRASVVKAAVEGRLTEQWREENPDVEPAEELLRRILEERWERWEQDQLANYEAKRQKPPKGWREKYEEPLAPPDGLPSVPPGWVWATVDQTASSVRYGSSAKTGPDENGVPVLRMGNIQEGELDLAQLKYLPASHSEFPGLLLQPGDLLFNRTNSAELVGKTAVYTGSPDPMSFASYLIAARLIPGCDGRYLNIYLNSAYGRSWVASVVSQQVGQANVNGSKLRAMSYPLPPETEQAEIIAMVEDACVTARVSQSGVSAAVSRSGRLRQAILARAFDGRLVPQDPADEPASLLLDRIKAERDQVQQIPKPGRRPARQPAGGKGYTLVSLPLDEME